MADEHVIRDALRRVGEAGLPDYTVIDVAGPAVGLDTDGDVDLGHFQGAADVADGVIVVCSCMLTGQYRVMRPDNRGARVQAALRIRRIGIRIGVLNRSQCVAVQQTFHDDLVSQSRRQGQGGAVILLGRADNRDGRFLLIEEGEFKAVEVFRNLIGIARRFTGISGADYGFVQFPAGNRRTAEGEGLADLQDLHVVIGDGVACHIHEMDSDGSVLIAAIIEVVYVAFRACRQNQGLFNSVREELHSFKLGMRRVKRSIIYRRRQFDDGRSVAGNAGYGQFRCNGDIARVLLRIKDILHGIAGRISLCGIHERDHVFAVFRREGNRITRRQRTVAGD